ncbi:MAG TPA: hypothetical protein VGG22_06880 [Candidatus Baltobacteraceae bacterium]
MRKPTFAAVAALAPLILLPLLAAAASEHASFTSGAVRETFVATASGGVEYDVVLDSDLSAVRKLRNEARRRTNAFKHGNFIDPTNPHGDLVPGLREMRHQWGRLHVRCDDLPNGSRIRYMTRDPVMVEALHQWFASRVVNKIR